MKAQSLIGHTLLPNFLPKIVSLRNALRFASLVAFLYLAVSTGLCQDTATLSGTVKDPTGLGVPDAIVILTNQKTADMRKSVTGATGTYSFTGLPAGDYKIQISGHGFADLEKVIALTAGRTNVDLPLMLAGNVESVSVDAKTDPYSVVPDQPTDAVFGLNQKISDIPRSISTVDSALLDLYSARTVNDLVTVVPGSYTAAYFGIAGSVFLRGDIADNYFRGLRRVENRGNYQTPVSASDHIEIVKGPPAPIYGPGRIGGFMNFYPKTVRSEAAKWMEGGHGAVVARYGEYDDKVGSGEYGMPFKIGSHRSGAYTFFETKDSHSFYRGVFDKYKLGQVAFDTELSPKWRLAYGFQGYNDKGIQALGWNRVTQDLIDHGTYLAGSPSIDLASNGSNIGPNQISAGLLNTFAFQQNMGAVFPYYGNSQLLCAGPRHGTCRYAASKPNHGR